LTYLSYGANTDQCPGGCCLDENIACIHKNKTIPETFLDQCNGKSSCFIASGEHIPAEDITCAGPGLVPATFAVFSYDCITGMFTGAWIE